QAEAGGGRRGRQRPAVRLAADVRVRGARLARGFRQLAGLGRHALGAGLHIPGRLGAGVSETGRTLRRLRVRTQHLACVTVQKNKTKKKRQMIKNKLHPPFSFETRPLSPLFSFPQLSLTIKGKAFEL
ncbi:hypothetical protein SKAU_G00074940, partial [Synaphobranchus kaupii]